VLLLTRSNHQVPDCPFAICFNGHLPSRIWNAQKNCRNVKLTGPMNSGWPGSDSGSSPLLVGVDFNLSICQFGDGLSLFRHIANGQKSASKSPSISQLDIILTLNWYQLTQNPLFPTCLKANYHIFQSRPNIHSTFSLHHNKNVKHIVTF
jgi:hypothetical protein